ncbi:MAG: glycosyltransferase family 4 protein [Candidatus Taylorbacteria bacterium]|nr:glycosyltransferase family 4 protein [Candidatus Taylorbacteria bacterium]
MKSTEGSVLFLVNKLKRGGAEKVFMNQASYLAGRHAIYLAAALPSSSADNYLIDYGMNREDVFFCDFKNFFDLGAFWRLRRFVRKRDIRVVYSTLEFSNVISRLLKIFSPSIRVIIRESGMAFRKPPMVKLLDIILNFLAFRIVAVSAAVRDSLADYQHLHAHKFVIIENGVPVLPYEVVAGLRADVFRKGLQILHVGSMNNDNKGHAELIDVFNSLSDELLANVSLTFAGDGNLRSSLEAKARKTKKPDKIIFVGNLTGGQMKAQYLSADIYILNSKNEGCPNTVLEAMSYGLPVLSTRVGGATEIIEDGKSGILVPVGDKEAMRDAIRNLLTDESLRHEMGKAAVLRIRDKYTLEGQISKLAPLLGVRMK